MQSKYTISYPPLRVIYQVSTIMFITFNFNYHVTSLLTVIKHTNLNGLFSPLGAQAPMTMTQGIRGRADWQPRSTV